MVNSCKNYWLVAGLLVALGALGCSEDDGPAGGDPTACDSKTYKTNCADGFLYACTSDRLSVTPCANGCDAAKAACAAQSETKECDPAMFSPVCINGVLTSCVGDKYARQNCTCNADGTACEGGTKECDSATHRDVCAGGVLTKCVNDKLVTQNCTCNADGTACGESDLTCKDGPGTKKKGETSGQYTFTGCACDQNYQKSCGVVDGKSVAFTCYQGNEEYLPCDNCVIVNNRYECGGGDPGGGDIVRGSVTHAEASYAQLGVKTESDANKSLEKFGTSNIKDGEFAIETCPALPASAGSTCTKSGSGAKTVLQGDILTKDKVIKGGSVVVEGNKITYVGCTPDITGATVITCADAVISAGLINAHDHIMYNNQAPDDWKAERFDARHDWRKNLNGHSNHNAQSNGNLGVSNEPGELRQLLAGATSVFGSGSIPGLQRNVDKDKIEGNPYPTYDTFPLKDSSGKMCNNSRTACGCSAFTMSSSFGSAYAFGPHVGEGINDYALNEMYCASGVGVGSKNGLTSKLAIIHGVAATPDIIDKMAKAGSKLIWSPRSNISLYGDTARVTVYDRAGVTIALGTDWTPSGSANMLREYACADFLNTYYYNNHFTDFQIWRMGTWNAAVALGLEKVIGDIAAGMVADIAICAKNGKEAHRAIIESDYKHVALVMLNGKFISGDANIMSGGENVTIGGVAKRVDTKASGSAKSFSQIKNEAKYPVFFDGVPTGEPTCVPMRTRMVDTVDNDIDGNKSRDISTSLYDGEYSDPNDRDGDGIPNDVDSCPDVFNPIRPQDKDKDGKFGQSDWDGDGAGDVCDLAPLDAKEK